MPSGVGGKEVLHAYRRHAFSFFSKSDRISFSESDHFLSLLRLIVFHTAVAGDEADSTLHGVLGVAPRLVFIAVIKLFDEMTDVAAKLVEIFVDHSGDLLLEVLSGINVTQLQQTADVSLKINNGKIGKISIRLIL